MNTEISDVKKIISDIREGKIVILVDEEDRENEGDLLVASEHVNPEVINFMSKYGRGLICLTLTKDRCAQLGLPLMVNDNKSKLGTNFTLSIESANGVTTGISAADRSHTIQTAVRKNAKPKDVVQPGHIFPLMAQDGGVLVRAGHTEAGCDLAKLAGLMPSSVICEILKDNGEMARMPDLIKFSKIHNINIGTISDLINYRSNTESLVEKVFERKILTQHGEFKIVGYKDLITNESHFAMIYGEVVEDEVALVRVHEPLSVYDLIDEVNQGHSWGLNQSMKKISENGSGVLVLLHRTETGTDLMKRFMGNLGGSIGKETLRNYGIGAQILKDLGVTRMKLMGKRRRMPSMNGFDLNITGYLEPK